MASDKHATQLPFRMLCESDSGRCWLALLALLMVSGCEALDRMDYLDQFFDPSGYSERHGRSERRSNRLAGTIAPANPGRERKHDLDVAPPQTSAPSATPDAPSRHTPDPLPASPQPGEQDGSVWVRSTIRQNGWLTRDWEQLTPAQQLRVERQLVTGRVAFTTEHTEPAAIWDTLGLTDRPNLAFGDVPAFARITSEKTHDASVRLERSQ